MSRNVNALLALAIALPIVTHATASLAEPPSALFGKSITVNWTEDRDQQVVGADDRKHTIAPQSIVVYISSAGRAFSRLSSTSRGAGGRGGSRRGGGGRSYGSSDQVDGSGDPTGFGKRDVVFNGGTMTVTNAFTGGARRIVANFGQGSSSCSASVTYGKGGSGGMIQRNFAGQRQRLFAVSISGESCTVRDGNALEN